MKFALRMSALLALALAFGCSTAKLTTAEFVAKLQGTYTSPSQRDTEQLTLFQEITTTAQAANPEIKAKLLTYKTLLGADTDAALIKMVFLLRRYADKDSFYAALDNWDRLQPGTQGEIFVGFGPTYKKLTDQTLAENQQLVVTLEGRSDLSGTVAKLPTEFQTLISAFSSDAERSDYLVILYLLMLNTVSVRQVLDAEVQL